jgi:MFS family permease
MKNLLRIRGASLKFQAPTSRRCMSAAARRAVLRTGENRAMALPKALSPLAERSFRLLWIGQAVSAAGDSLSPVALAFATLQIAHSASALGLVLAASTTARVVFLPIGGVWADRLPRQVVMLSSDGTRAAAELVLAGLLLTGHAQIWMLIVLSVADGAAGAFFIPASGALVPQTVSAERLQQANALMGLSRSTTSVAGPAASGVLVALIGPGWVFAIDAATYLVSASSLAMLRVAPMAAREASSFWSELAAGWRAVSSRRWYLLNLCSHAMWNFAIAAFFVLGPIVAKQHLGGASAWGLISASIGAGSLVGGLIALRVMPRRPLIVANLALPFSALEILALVPPLPTIAIMGACVIGFIGLTFLNEVWNATIPQLIPADVLARANSIDWVLSLIAMPAGFAICGPIADHIGIPATLIGAAIILAVPSFLIVLHPGVRGVRRTPEGLIVAADS